MIEIISDHQTPSTEAEPETQAFTLHTDMVGFAETKFGKRLTDLDSPLFHLPENLQIPEGVLLVCGQNGSGKTTLVRALEFALQPENLSFQGDSSRLRYMPAESLSKFLTVPEDRISIPIDASLLNSRSNGNSRRERVDQSMKQILADYDKNLHLYQEGQNPHTEDIVLILDEPESGMDPLRQEKIVEEMKMLQNYAKIVVIATNSPVLWRSDLPRIDLNTPEKGVFVPSEELNRVLSNGMVEGIYEENI